MQLTFDSVSDLAQALRRAADAHGRHERQIGHPDPDWPTWYALYLEQEQAAGESASCIIQKTGISFGPDSRNRLAETADPSACGAQAALESFYYAWHHGDADALRTDWSASPLAQLNNPAGGILRGGDAIAGLYQKAFAASLNVRVTFGDVVAYYGQRSRRNYRALSE